MTIEPMAGPRRAADRAAEGWLECLHELHAAERRLGLDLRDLFTRTRWLPLRLVLADQRRETKRHLGRLESLIQRPERLKAIRRRAIRAESVGASIPAAAVVAGPLAAAGATVIRYRTALSTANRLGLAYAADLLTSSLTEEETTLARLMRMAAEIESQ